MVAGVSKIGHPNAPAIVFHGNEFLSHGDILLHIRMQSKAQRLAPNGFFRSGVA